MLMRTTHARRMAAVRAAVLLTAALGSPAHRVRDNSVGTGLVQVAIAAAHCQRAQRPA